MDATKIHLSKIRQGITKDLMPSALHLFVMIMIFFILSERYCVNSLNIGEKEWSQSSSLGNADLWYSGNLPCIGQKVRLPENEVVYFPDQLSIGPEIQLPQNGMILFPSSGSIFMSSEPTKRIQPSSDCLYQKNSTAIFRNPEYQSWFDPDNWISYASSDIHKLYPSNGDKTSPVPHLQRVPCRYDKASFPLNAAYKMSLAYHNIDLSWLSVANQQHSTETFRGLYTGGQYGKYGRMMFQINTTLTVKKDFCPFEGDGCVCGNDDKINTICGTEGAKCPLQPQCSSSLKPKDHCCYDICGAVIHVETNPGLYGYGNTLDLLHDSVRKYLPTKDKTGFGGSDDSYSKPGQGSKDTNKNEKYKNVAFHASRISENYYQIVLVDRANNIQNAIDIAYQAYDQIMSHNNGKDLNRFYVWVETSGTGPPSVWKTPGGVFGAIILSFLCVIIVYLLVKGEIKKTSVYVEVTRLYGYVPNFPVPSNVREFINNKLNWRDGRSRSIDLSFSRLGAGSRVEETSGNFENPLYQEFCKRTTEEPTELGIDSGIKESGSSLSFKALQGRIEGVQINNKNEANLQIHHGPRKLENRSFNNPMFGVIENLQSDKTLAKTSAGQPNHLDVNLLTPVQKSSSNPSIKSNKSTKSLKSLLGFNKDTVVESPMLDLSVDIGKEASKFDSFGFQDPELNEKSEIGSVTQFEDEDKTIKVTTEAPLMLSSNLASMQQVADQFVSGAKGQCQKMLAGTKKADDKEALINDEETEEDISLQTNTSKIVSTDLDHILRAKQDEKPDKDDDSATTLFQTQETHLIESIGFPSNTVPEDTTLDDSKNTTPDDEEFLVSFD